MTTSPSTIWTPERVAKLDEYVSAGYSAARTAEQMADGTSVASVQAKARKIGLRFASLPAPHPKRAKLSAQNRCYSDEIERSIEAEESRNHKQLVARRNVEACNAHLDDLAAVYGEHNVRVVKASGQESVPARISRPDNLRSYVGSPSAMAAGE